MAEREVGAAAAMGGDVAAPGPGSSDPNLVLWDLELCPLPDSMEEMGILSWITDWLYEWGYTGPVEMLAVGRPKSLPQYKLAYSGIFISHVSDGRRSFDLNGKHTSDGLLGALSSWIKNKPAPANLLLIAGDRSFDSKVESLRNDNYNILLRQQECTCYGVKNHAKYCWSWWEIFDGERPHGFLKRSRFHDGPSLLGERLECWPARRGEPMEGWPAQWGELMEGWSGPTPFKFAPS